jgi:glycosyltransferase involved in cell wall biosynthesis
MALSVHLFSRGPADQVSGGYRYNRNILRALEAAGHRVAYHPDAVGLAEIREGDTCLIDGLALPELADRLLDAPGRLVLVLHTDPAASGSKGTPSAALLSRSRVVVTGLTTLDAVRALPGGEAADVRWIEPGVPSNWRTRSTYAKTATRLLSVSNYVPGKGYLRLLDALAELSETDWSLRAFGNTDLDPEHAKRVREASAGHGLSPRVRLDSSIDHADVCEEMMAADLLLVPSERESYSIATAEAVACALPVLSHRTGAVDRFCHSGRVRYVDAMDPEALREGLRSLICDPRAYDDLTGPRRGSVRTWETVGVEFVDWLAAP